MTQPHNENQLKYTKTKRRILSFLPALVLFAVLAVMFVSAGAAVDDIGSSLPKKAGDYRLTHDIILTTAWKVPTGGTTELDLNGFTIKLLKGKAGSVIVVPEGASLKISDESVRKTGKIMGGNTSGYIIDLDGDGILDPNGDIMGDGIGGGVYVNGGDFDLLGGTITENFANLGGGVAVANGGSFEFMGGAITNNIAAEFGGGVYIKDGSIDVFNGTIKGNIGKYSGGGMFSKNGLIRFFNGSIQENSANLGGGVGIELGTFEMTTGYITANSAVMGGGIFLEDGNVKIEDGYIHQNTASDEGGAVAVNSSGSFIISGGLVTDNLANDRGAGVMLMKNSKFTVEGGVIERNFITDPYTESNVYISTGNKIIMSGSERFKEGSIIGITTEEKPVEKKPVEFAESYVVNYSRNFTADEPIYHVVRTKLNTLNLEYTPVVETQTPVITNTTNTTTNSNSTNSTTTPTPIQTPTDTDVSTPLPILGFIIGGCVVAGFAVRRRR